VVTGDVNGNILRALIDANAQVTNPAIMHRAAEQCTPKVLQILVNAEARVNVLARDLEYNSLELGSPLQAACLLGKRENINFLLEHGADTNLGGGRWENPLCAAIHQAGQQPEDTDIIQLLFDHGANPNTPGILYQAVWQACWNKSKPVEMANIVRCILDAGANVNEQDQFGQTALYHAAFHGATDTVSLLLQRQADLTTGRSPLLAAVSQNHVDIVRMLRET
jgi:ankyrin repeat protein